ncbi:MAG TPA: sulfatase [Candidatus Brocadiia bacterium]|nr:sulfatase [Candidatus Brocadiia bacterium]
MNFIIVVSDTLRRDFLGCYGNRWISTPNIDLFAARSIVFDRAYSASFPTVPHRRDLMTGRYTFTYTPWAPLSRDEPVMSEYLAAQGYSSMMICDCPHILEDGYNFDRGFTGFEWIRGQETDRWKTTPRQPEHPCDPAKIRSAGGFIRHHRRNAASWRHEEDRFVARTMSAACLWLEENYREKDFFLYVDTFDPHEPWDAPQWYVEMYDPGYDGQAVDYPLYNYSDFLTEKELKHCRALYAAEVTLVDRWVGRLLSKIEDMGLLDETVVALTTDHGFLHGEHGIMGKALHLEQGFYYCPLFEEIAHVPLVISFPGADSRRSEAIVQPPDFLPTMLELAGRKDRPAGINGKSFAGVLRGERDTHREFAVSSPHILRGGAGGTTATVSDGKWAAIITGKQVAQPSTNDRAVDGQDKQIAEPERSRDMLFNIEDDPGQQRDLMESDSFVHRAMRRKLVELLEESGTAPELIEPWR